MSAIGRPGLCALALVAVMSGAVHAAGRDARAELAASMAAMGGEATLQSLHRLRFAAIGHRNMLEQSVRPEALLFADYFQIEETRDFDRRAERVTQRHRGYSSPDWYL